MIKKNKQKLNSDSFFIFIIIKKKLFNNTNK